MNPQILYIALPSLILGILLMVYVWKEEKTKKTKDISDDHNLHMEIHQQKMKEIMVLDPLKYRGKGRPRKSDYSSVFEIQNRQISARLLKTSTYK